MILYVTYSTFGKWAKDLREEIKIRMIRSGSKITMDDYFPIQNKRTRKHIGFEFSSSENGKSIYHNVLRHRPDPARVLESVIKITVLNEKKFISFMLKYSKKFEFIDSIHIMYM